jgi:hypothetical protein
MNIDLTLAYKTILRNEPRPVHLVATLGAPKLKAHTVRVRQHLPLSLTGLGLWLANRFGWPARPVEPSFAICARTICLPSSCSTIPRRSLFRRRNRVDRHGMIAAIERIGDGGSTNLIGRMVAWAR